MWHVASEMKTSASTSTVTTLGVDATKKKGGHKLFDVNTGHLTLINEEKSRTTFSLGFLPNISHSGSDSSKSVGLRLDQMAVLTGDTREETLSYIDFFIADRAGDNKIMLNELGVGEEKKLDCNSHVILCVEESIDTVFRDYEIRAGKDKLITAEAAHVFSSPQNSIFRLGELHWLNYSPLHMQLIPAVNMVLIKSFLNKKLKMEIKKLKRLPKKDLLALSATDLEESQHCQR